MNNKKENKSRVIASNSDIYPEFSSNLDESKKKAKKTSRAKKTTPEKKPKGSVLEAKQAFYSEAEDEDKGIKLSKKNVSVDYSDIDSDTVSRATLTIKRINVSSVARVSFLLSVAFSIFCLVAVILLWLLFNVTGLFSKLTSAFIDAGFFQDQFNVGQFFGFTQVLSFAIIFCVCNIIGFTLLSTIFSAIYNIIVKLVGGIKIILSDD